MVGGFYAVAAGYPAHVDLYISDFGEVKGVRVEGIHSIKMPALVLQFSYSNLLSKTMSFLGSGTV